ncbi:MAG TPA: UDP-N-acetylmuramate--L-alanine ligase [Candidatus Saccharimonadales bacterium]|nr:UDP-N-acetylmuramate--L-alanine ligase [Candidatus Saccharimonadales bacterium]
MYGKSRNIHLVGIGGTGMCGIAEVLRNLGYAVSGSDLRATEVTERLERLGIRVCLGHRAEHVDGADLVVVSSAIHPDNPEYQRALALGLPVVPRAEMLAELMRVKYGVAVAGAHGKTTTTSLLAMVLSQGGLDPTVVVGGRLKAFGSNARLGTGDFLVAEADESDGSFLMLSPAIAVVTNIDAEHLDHYRDLVEIRRAFIEFVNKVPFYGVAVLCAEDRRVREILPFVRRRQLTYAISQEADWQASDIRREGDRTHFTASFRGVPWGEFAVRLYGRHNVLNALAAVAVAEELDVSPEAVRRALHDFEGVARRFERKGEVNGVTVVDDYGHHPTELAAVLDTAASLQPGRLVAVFQPHRFSRTAHHWREFGVTLARADVVLVLPVYAAGEAPLPGVTSELVAEAARSAGAREVHVAADFDAAEALLGQLARPGDLVLTLGAGDVWKVGERLISSLALPGRLR